ncbi:MFS transporter [Oleiharenicola lentus]|uniref:MFS transporter n=1 Tax=Oleiharenicola lentus TaxID=2508720 RepID=UPI003F674F1B
MSGPSSLAARAWLTVGLLWVVGCLNYLDRVMITTMRGSILKEIPMTDAQFGLLTTVFLLVYAVLSPFAGFLADRFNRSRVIIISFLTWSAVTWLTAHAKTFEQLLATRALMGISEACYIPAALALIADYHRTTTRSFANGVHMSGVMVGSGLGGLGGWIAERHGWSHAFTLFGQLGIGLAVVLIFLLKDRADRPEVEETTATPSPVRLTEALRSLLGDRNFLLALVYWGLLGASAWAVVGWMPTYLNEQFNLSQGQAGLSATGYLQAAALAGVLLGGAWADRWSRKDARGPIYVVMIGLALSAPSILVVSVTESLTVAIVGLVVFGLTKAFADANMMPILTLVADRRYRATGYGLLNFCACVIGGATIYVGGLLRDANVSVVKIFQFGGLSFFVSLAILFLLKPGSRKS